MRTLTVKLMRHGTSVHAWCSVAREMPVTLFFQCGDWAVTQGLCTAHADKCYRLTHIPSTYCIPICLQDRNLAETLCRRINQEIPKFKRKPRPEIVRQFSTIVKEMLAAHGSPLILMPGYQPHSPKA